MNALRDVYKKYEHVMAWGAFLGGFLWDTLTLTRIDLWIDNLMLFLYIVIAGTSITLFNLYDIGRLQRPIFRIYAPWLPLVMQFAFGGLFSGYVVYYSRSAAFATSWPFLFFLAVLLVGNEFSEKRYHRFTFNVSILFVAIFSFLTFYMPIVLGSLGASTFLISGWMSLVVIGALLFLFMRIMPERMKSIKYLLFISIGGIYILFNVFYFTNIIPPIPLSIIESGIYYNVERYGDEYRVTKEDRPWYVFWKREHVFYRSGNNPIYSYSAVFAPTKLQTKIIHRWLYYNEKTGAWIQTDEFPYAIYGGRDGGYRGYSVKHNVFPGRWRVDVITERKQLLGRTTFMVRDAEKELLLTTEIR